VVQWDATHQGSNPGARTFYWDFLKIYRRYALSGKRHSRRQLGANVDFGYLQICRVLNPSEVLIGIGLRTCVHRGECAYVL
jgi:hypothetical protein